MRCHPLDPNEVQNEFFDLQQNRTTKMYHQLAGACVRSCWGSARI